MCICVVWLPNNHSNDRNVQSGSSQRRLFPFPSVHSSACTAQAGECGCVAVHMFKGMFSFMLGFLVVLGGFGGGFGFLKDLKLSCLRIPCWFSFLFGFLPEAAQGWNMFLNSFPEHPDCFQQPWVSVRTEHAEESFLSPFSSSCKAGPMERELFSLSFRKLSGRRAWPSCTADGCSSLRGKDDRQEGCCSSPGVT